MVIVWETAAKNKAVVGPRVLEIAQQWGRACERCERSCRHLKPAVR